MISYDASTIDIDSSCGSPILSLTASFTCVSDNTAGTITISSSAISVTGGTTVTL